MDGLVGGLDWDWDWDWDWDSPLGGKRGMYSLPRNRLSRLSPDLEDDEKSGPFFLDDEGKTVRYSLPRGGLSLDWDLDCVWDWDSPLGSKTAMYPFPRNKLSLGLKDEGESGPFLDDDIFQTRIFFGSLIFSSFVNKRVCLTSQFMNE